MNNTSLLLISTLSILSINGLVLGEVDQLSLSVCSFIPNTPRPAVIPTTQPIIKEENEQDRRVSENQNTWPKPRNDIMKLAKEALEYLIKQYGDLYGKVSVSDVIALYSDSEKENGKVSYDITYNVTLTDDIDEKVWDEFKYELLYSYNYIEYNKNITKFYEYFKSKSEDDFSYGICIKPDYLKHNTPCDYKTSYIFTVRVGEKRYINPLINKVDDLDISFSISCANNLLSTYYNGTVVVPTNRPFKYISCNVMCYTNEYDYYKYGYTTFTVKVIDVYARYDEVLSTVPTIIYSGKTFSVKIKLNMPDGLDTRDYNSKIEFDNIYNCNMSKNNFITEFDKISNSFKFTNLYINCSERYYYKYVDMKITSIIDNIKYDYPMQRIDVVVDKDYYCYKNENLEPDLNGLCCERNTTLGEICTYEYVSIPFSTVYHVSYYRWDLFVTSFLNTLKRVVFNHTNFNIGNEYDYYNYLSTSYISFTVTFYEYYMWDYNDTNEGGDELVGTSSLQSANENWRELSSPYVFINTILSYVNPARFLDLPEEEETTCEEVEEVILRSIPDELSSFISKYPELKNKLVETIELIPKAVKETMGKSNIDVHFDINSDIHFRYNRKYPTVKPSPVKEDDKSWVEEYWWVILLICVGVVLIIAIITVIIFRVKKRKQAKVSIEN